MQLTQNISKELTDQDPAAYYIYIFKEFITFLNEHSALVNTAMDSSALPALLDILAGEIQSDIYWHLKEQEKKGFQYPMSLHVLAAFYAGGIIQITREKLNKQIAGSDEELIKQYKAIIASFQPACVSQK